MSLFVDIILFNILSKSVNQESKKTRACYACIINKTEYIIYVITK